MRVILLPTVPHTGTHFMAALLKATGEVTHEVSFDQLSKNPCAFRDPQVGYEGLDPSGINLVRGHIRGNAGDPMNALIANIAAHWQPIIPLRDPLATLVSVKSRVPELDAMDNVARWTVLVEQMDLLAPHYIPLDLLTDYGSRVPTIRNTFLAAGLGHNEPLALVVRRWAHEWPKDRYNSVGVGDLKIAYANRDLGYLKNHGLGSEIETLQAQEDLFRPWLEERGYRNLIWWA